LKSSAGLVKLAYSESAALVAVTKQSAAPVAETVVAVGCVQFVPTTANVTAPVPDPPAVVNVIGDPTVLTRIGLDTVSHNCGLSVVPTVNLKNSAGLETLA